MFSEKHNLFGHDVAYRTKIVCSVSSTGRVYYCIMNIYFQKSGKADPVFNGSFFNNQEIIYKDYTITPVGGLVYDNYGYAQIDLITEGWKCFKPDQELVCYIEKEDDSVKIFLDDIAK